MKPKVDKKILVAFILDEDRAAAFEFPAGVEVSGSYRLAAGNPETREYWQHALVAMAYSFARVFRKKKRSVD